MKKQARDWKKMFAKGTSYKALLSKIYKKLLNLYNKNINNLIQNGPKALMDNSPKETYRRQIST